MKLSELKKGDRALIKDIIADMEFKNRLLSFGIARGEEIEVKAYSLAKQTIEIDIEGTLIALRKEEADKIEVEIILKGE